MTPRDRLQRLIQGRPTARPLYLPLLGTYLARYQGTSSRAATADPTRLFNLLRDSQRLLGADAHLVLPDPTLLAEAAGAPLSWSEAGDPSVGHAPWEGSLPAGVPKDPATSGRVGVALEALRRLKVAEPGVGLGVVLTGPAELCVQLRGSRFLDEAAAGEVDAEDAIDLGQQVILAVLRAAGEVGVDLVVVLDPALGRLAAASAELARQAWTPLANLAAYYDSRVVAVVGGDRDPGPVEGRPGDLVALASLPCWAIVSEAWPSVAALRPSQPLGIGLGPRQLLAEDDLGAWLADAAAGGPWRFVSTAGPVPDGVPLPRLLAVKEWLQARAD